VSDPAPDAEPPFHLFLELEEVPTTAQALRLFIGDEAHEPEIRKLGREVLAELDGEADELRVLTVTLTPQQMKITHSALRLLLNDVQRGQAQEREMLQRILAKLPDEHTMRAIELH